MTLAAELEAYRASSADGAEPAELKLMRDNNALLAGLVKNAAGVGDRFPRLVLGDQLGRKTDLGALSDAGPLVVNFYRGNWCPYCNIELRAYQKALPEIIELGARLVAISPETPDYSLTTTEKNSLAFPVLSDAQGQLADALRIRFELSSELVDLYKTYDIDLPTQNGEGRWSLPIPATYVVEKGGLIAAALIDADYEKRMEPAMAIAALKALNPRATTKTPSSGPSI